MIKGDWIGRGSNRLGWLHTLRSCIKMLITDMKCPLARVSFVLVNSHTWKWRGGEKKQKQINHKANIYKIEGFNDQSTYCLFSAVTWFILLPCQQLYSIAYLFTALTRLVPWSHHRESVVFWRGDSAQHAHISWAFVSPHLLWYAAAKRALAPKGNGYVH